MVQFLGEIVSDILETLPEALSLFWSDLDHLEGAHEHLGGSDGTQCDLPEGRQSP